MNEERLALLGVIYQRVGGDLVRDILAFAAEQLMARDADAATGAPSGARSPNRTNHRNGYRQRA